MDPVTNYPAAPSVVRVVLVDDDPLVRAGLRMILGGDCRISIVGEAGDGGEGVNLVLREVPDVVLMDIRMPRMDGLEATRRLLAARPSLRIIVLTTFAPDDTVLTALRIGAAGYMLKDTPPQRLVAAVHQAAAGEPMLSPSVTAILIASVASSAPELASQLNPRAESARQRAALLTERERDVALAVGQGLSNAEIAEALFMSVATVKSHVGKVFTKLAATNRVQITLCLHDAGLLS